jgi:hypothetical protein
MVSKRLDQPLVGFQQFQLCAKRKWLFAESWGDAYVFEAGRDMFRSFVGYPAFGDGCSLVHFVLLCVLGFWKKSHEIF